MYSTFSGADSYITYNETNLINILAFVIQFKFEFTEFVIEPLDLLFHFSLPFISTGDWENRFDLGEQTPPLPIAQPQVTLYVALDHTYGSVMLYTLLVSPGR